jgi:gamma-glutamylputrescine oxidase
VCVVGLGGSGLVAVSLLIGKGVRVIGVDAEDIGAGAAGRNGGFLLAGLPEFYHEAVRKLGHDVTLSIYQQTLRELDLVFEEFPTFTRKTGSLRIAVDADELEDCRKQYNAMTADKLPVEWYKGPEGEGLLVPSDGVMNPLNRVREMARRVQAAGAILHSKTKVTEIKGSEVITNRGVIRCRKVIVAVDGCLELLIPELKDRVRTARLQMLATGPATDVRFTRPVYRRDGYDYW